MTGPRVIRGIFGSAKGAQAHRPPQRPTRPCECPRCGRPYMPARPSSVRVVEWTDADGYHTDLELCPIRTARSGCMAADRSRPWPAIRMTRAPGARRWRHCRRPSTKRTPRFTTGPAIFSRIRRSGPERGQERSETRPGLAGGEVTAEPLSRRSARGPGAKRQDARGDAPGCQ